MEYLPDILPILSKESGNIFYRSSILCTVSGLVIGEQLLYYGLAKGHQLSIYGLVKGELMLLWT